jgi:4-amino-4-deoxy-L-arabinose transferase-like glycosyltransferase
VTLTRFKAEPDAAARIPGAGTVSRRTLLLAFAVLFALNLLLRVFYLRYNFVNGDETVRALTAVRLLDGARLYVDVVTDKPPGAALFYAGVFAAFGRSMVALHLVAIVWNFLTAIIVYLIAARAHTKRTGLWAALIFVYFSTNYLTQDMMAANTELLMLPAYAGSVYFYLGRRPQATNNWSFSKRRMVLAGSLTGLAAFVKQVGVFNLVFFVLCEAAFIYAARGAQAPGDEPGLRRAIRFGGARLLLIGTGFAGALAAMGLWLFFTGSLAAFWHYAVAMGMLYVESLSWNLWFEYLITRAGGYVLFNAALWILVVWAAARTVVSLEAKFDAGSIDGMAVAPARPPGDLAFVLWALCSLAGVFTGARFYGHYFIQALPALSLLGARGLELLLENVKNAEDKRRYRFALVLVAVLFVGGLVRCHGRTAILAYETLTSSRTTTSASWGMTQREEEAKIVADELGRRTEPGGALYIWDNALDVYWQTGRRPASRYLTSYYITGRFEEGSDLREAPGGEALIKEARANLLNDLRRTRPRLILDVYGKMKTFPDPDIKALLESKYLNVGAIGPDSARPFFVYQRRDVD